MRFPRTLIVLLAAAVIASAFGLLQIEPAAAGKRSCTGWTSRMTEPKFIRVKDTRTGKVHRVRFKRYVLQVMASGEWPSRLPKAVLKAGAFATKQYGHYYSMRGHYRGGRSRGRCYDIVNTTSDQLWRHWARPTPKQKRAVNAVWGLSAWKWGVRFFLTGYRAGYVRTCGADSNGWKLYARSAKNCANKRSWSWKRILRKYYSKTAFRWNKEAKASGKTFPRR